MYKPNGLRQQVSFGDRISFLTKREVKRLEKSWAYPFSTLVFPNINESSFSVLYCPDNGRANTPVNVIIGALILKSMFMLTDEDLLDRLVFDLSFQYALHLTSCDEIPLSDRTLSRFRERLIEHERDTGEDLLHEEMERLGQLFARMKGIDGRLQRMDSLMVATSSKTMGRLELMYTCISNMVSRLLKTNQVDLLPEHFLQYTDDNRNAYCYRLNEDEVESKLESIASDGLLLLELTGYARSCSNEFELLERALDDQTENGRLKQRKLIKPDSLQNPSDEDATFRYKGNKSYKGYTAGFVEACGDTGNMIIRYEYKVNLHSDVAFGAKAIESHGYQKERTVMVADGAYGSEANFAAAEANNIELVVTSLTGKEPQPIINEFVIDDTIKSCPEGHIPTDSTYDAEQDCFRAHFNREICHKCPRYEQCPATLQKKRAVVRLTRATVNRAAYAARLTSGEFKQHARLRNGVEGIPSVLRRVYRVDSMPVRGLLRTKLWFGFMIGAINAKRVMKLALNETASRWMLVAR